MGLFEALAARNGIAKLKENGGVGYVEPGKVYTFDGNTSGKVTFGISECVYVKISNDTPDLNGIAKGRGFLSGGEFEFDKSGLSIETFESGQSAIHPEIVAPLILSVVKADATIPEPGLYLLSIGIDYVSRVEFAETIHPIDPKFLPGVCLPVVVNLSKYEASGQTFSALIEGLVMNGGGTVSVDVEQFMKDASTDGVLILELEVMDATVRTSAVTSMLNYFDYTTEQLCFSALVDMGTGLMNVSVLIDRFNTDGSITVAVS